ncbi:SDR family NAD(P)-dependent oxidoreductase [Nocardioides marmoraquaticus]
MTAGASALVTGGASGIGLAVARSMTDRGMEVTIADVDSQAVAGAVADLGRAGTCPRGVVADVSTPEGAVEAVRAASSPTGTLDHLHLNAGRAGPGPVVDGLDLDRARDVLVTNVMAAMSVFAAALPALTRSCLPGGASVVVTSSLAGVIGSPTDPVYAASKHALVGLVRSLAPAHPGIRISAVCPSLVDTPLVDAARLLRLDLPVLDAADVAHSVIALLTDQHGTGQVVVLEAGASPTVVPEPIVSAMQKTP